MKKEKLFLMMLFMFIFILAGVSALPCQLILKSECNLAGGHILLGVSSVAGGRVEIASGSEYEYAICCDIPGELGDCGVDDEYLIVYMSNISDAGIKIPGEYDPNYPIKLCHRFLWNCEAVLGNCEVGVKHSVFKLDRFENASIVLGGFLYRICCQFSGFRWTDLDDSGIDEIEVMLNETEVKLNLLGLSELVGLSLPTGFPIEFEVYEDDLFGEDNIRTDPGFFTAIDSDGNAHATWVINSEDWANAGGESTADFRFGISGFPLRSPILKVTLSGETCGVNIFTCSDYGNESAMCSSDCCSVANYSGDLEFNVGEPFCGINNVSCFCFVNSSGDCKVGYSSPSSSSACGDGIVQAGEVCDGENMGNVFNCSDYSPLLTGNISCIDPDEVDECKFDLSLCTGIGAGVCPDGDLNIGEECDPMASDPLYGINTSCTNYGEFKSGEVGCFANCEIDTSSCVPYENICIKNLLYVEGDCDDSETEFIIAHWEGIWDGLESERDWDECPASGTSTILCPSKLRLDFFGFWNFIVVIFILAGLYFFNKDFR